MAGICSRHQGYVVGCVQCEADPRDMFPNWDDMIAAAEAAGRYTCHNCKFVYFKTTDTCPSCSCKRQMDAKTEFPAASTIIWKHPEDYNIKKCVICEKMYDEHGNAAWPIKQGECCDKCNTEVVSPERIRMARWTEC